MKRLIAKELREHWPYIAGALVGSTGMILVVDPRFFWDRSVWGGWLAIPVLIFFVMGLSAYSREYSRETLSFALSRPVRWWWLYLAKMLAGLIACTLVAAISSGVHVAACRESYRPFLDAAGVGNGFARMAVSSGLAFVMGLALSCVVPGVGFSFLAATGFWFAFVMVTVSCLPVVHGVPELLIPLILPGAALVAGVLAVRTPVVLTHGRRIWLWLKVVGPGLALCCLVIGVFAVVGVRSRETWVASDFRATASNSYVQGRLEGRPHELWIRVGEGQPVLIDRQRMIEVVDWSPDSRTLVYIVDEVDATILKAARAADGWRATEICELPPGVSPGRAPSYVWSPSAEKLAMDWGHHFRVRVVSLRSRRCETVHEGSIRHFWWVDDQRVAVMDDNGKVTVADVAD